MSLVTTYILKIIFLVHVSVNKQSNSLYFLSAVVNTMNEKFRNCLAECKQLNSAGLLRQTGATADKILYNHAIEMVIKINHNYLTEQELTSIRFTRFTIYKSVFI